MQSWHQLSSLLAACSVPAERCQRAGDLEALCAELASLESASQGAPLLCVQQGGEEPDYGSMELSSPLASESHSETPLQDWEVM